MNQSLKKGTFIILLAPMGALLSFLFTWESPDVNWGSEHNIFSCIHKDERKLELNFSKNNGPHFKVFFVPNSKFSCINPYFPSIHIRTEVAHNAWVQIVYTDSKAPEWQTFIDSGNKSIKRSPYPFYTYEADFSDSPLWRYSMFSKPLSFWKGHAFAVEVNHQNKTIKCLGGIEWGFKLSFTRIRPVAITPRLLDEKDWENAWKWVKDKLPDYKTVK